jgi:hypothetical protein
LQFNLPNGINEHFTLVLTAAYSHRGGKGNRLVVMQDHKVVASVVEHSSREVNMVDVFADQVMTTFTSVGLLDEGKVIVLSARDHRMISIPIKDIQDVVKDQAFAFVLSTEEAQKNRSVLSQVVWNNDNSELQVIKSL